MTAANTSIAGHGVLVVLRQALLDSNKRRKLFTMDVLERQLGAKGALGTRRMSGSDGFARRDL